MGIGQIAYEPEGDVVVLTLRGEHDLSTVPAVRHELDRVVAGDGGIVVDMTGTEFIDSSILGAIVATYRALRSSGGGERPFAVAATPGGPVSRLLDLVAVADLVRVYPTRADAVAAVRGAGT
jgi:anti-sigma B factor antagonist